MKIEVDDNNFEEKVVKQEVAQYFLFNRKILSRLVHDDDFENGEILNFRKMRR